PPASPAFTGRKDILFKLEEYFTSAALSTRQRVFVLYGLGGAGKTQIARKFIEQNQSGPESFRYYAFSIESYDY
ncbi:hypothetical protein JAAARDRAFT_144167, partial [Jaapia argillacea MUCL 33604]